MKPIVSIVMGSVSDLPIMKEAADFLQSVQVPYELQALSAHRVPEDVLQFAKEAAPKGIKVIIAGAGGAAHLPGVIASSTPLPVIGVPIKSSNSLDGWDSILSILQMPSGIPVATVALNGAKNAAILSLQILALSTPPLMEKLITFKQDLASKVRQTNQKLQSTIP